MMVLCGVLIATFFLFFNTLRIANEQKKKKFLKVKKKIIYYHTFIREVWL